MSQLLIVGAGGHGKVVAEAALASQRWREVTFLDGRFPELSRVADWLVIGSDRDAGAFLAKFSDCSIAIGDNRLRLEFLESMERAGFRMPVVTHPGGWVSPSAKVGVGSVVMAGAVVSAAAVVGRGCIINTGATVDHDCQIGDGVHVSPGANIGGEVVVGALTWIGIGASVRHCVSIGTNVTVGAGAAVVCDVADGVTVLGVPAKPL